MWELKQSLLQPQKPPLSISKTFRNLLAAVRLKLQSTSETAACSSKLWGINHIALARFQGKKFGQKCLIDNQLEGGWLLIFCFGSIHPNAMASGTFFLLKLADCDLRSGWSTSWWIANLSQSRAWLVSQVKKNITYSSWSFRQLTLFAYIPSWESPLREADSTKVEKNSFREFGRERVVALMRLAEPPMHHASFARHQLHHRHHHHHH